MLPIHTEKSQFDSLCKSVGLQPGQLYPSPGLGVTLSDKPYRVIPSITESALSRQSGALRFSSKRFSFFFRIQPPIYHATKARFRITRWNTGVPPTIYSIVANLARP